MQEFEVISIMLQYLIANYGQNGNYRWTADVRTNEQFQSVLQTLNIQGNGANHLDRAGSDIHWASINLSIEIEVKGSYTNYSLYTALGQLISACSAQNQFNHGIAIPSAFMDRLRVLLFESQIRKPLWQAILDVFNQAGRSLIFFFVDENGRVDEINANVFI